MSFGDRSTPIVLPRFCHGLARRRESLRREFFYPRQQHPSGPQLKLTGYEALDVIVLSDEFYQEITSHPIPTDLEVVKVLASAPAALDLYAWLSYRCFTAKGDESVPIFGPFGLIRQIGSVEYSCERRFRAKLEQWLRTIRLIWPECPARIATDGRYLVVGHAFSVLRDQK